MRREAFDISVVMPAYNSADTLGAVLDGFEHQTASAFEVIVIDDGSEDETTRIVERAAGRQLDVRCLRQAHAGRSAARNLGISEARSDLVLFLDSDVVPHAELIEQHLRSHEELGRKRAWAVLGRIALPPWREIPPLMRYDAIPKWSTINGRSELPWHYFCTGNISVSKAFVEQAGGFDESLPRLEDTELGRRLGREGMRIHYNPAAIGFHVDEINVPKYVEKAKAFGEALAVLTAREPEFLEVFPAVGGRFWQGSLLKSLKHLAKRLAVNGVTAPPIVWMAKKFEQEHGGFSAWLVTKTYAHFLVSGFNETRVLSRSSNPRPNTREV